MQNHKVINLENVHVRFRKHIDAFSIKDFVINSSHIMKKKSILEDINLAIFQGQSVGILGKNGSGKSTLLRAIAGIIKPYKGQLHITGQIAPILTLGGGIELEMTGYENIDFMISLLGLAKSKEAIDAIAHFSELDTKTLQSNTKTYSTGMLARLAFSIAFAQNADIYMIDEVLAVGDAGFQAKCIDKIYSLKKSNKTILFVSHSCSDVMRICDNAILLQQGKIIAQGNANDICLQYEQMF